MLLKVISCCPSTDLSLFPKQGFNHYLERELLTSAKWGFPQINASCSWLGSWHFPHVWLPNWTWHSVPHGDQSKVGQPAFKTVWNFSFYRIISKDGHTIGFIHTNTLCSHHVTLCIFKIRSYVWMGCYISFYFGCSDCWVLPESLLKME